MKKSSTSRISDLRDEYPVVTPADMDRAKFRIGLSPVPRKQRINMMLDSGIIAYFKARAGGRGYQTFINEALKRTIESESLETLLRRVIKEELDRQAARKAS
ncbi:MAG: BrnA antitoxin family protein [Acidobacteriota bacterium]